ncbi:MAG: DUF1566 domain-containing protein [Candidatus Sedimenticola sp. (ex Thyasira tokunagai)]
MAAQSDRKPAHRQPPTEEDKLTCFTNTSSLTTMLAPGAEIVAGDTVMSGTSQAAPHTTGAVAALLGKHPELTPDQVSKRLRHTGIPITDPRNSTPYARLDLVALFEGDLNRPRPVEEQHEWFRVNQVNGQKLPLLNDPWLIQSQTRDELVHDKAGGLTWLKPSALPQKLQGEVPLRTAHNFCRRIWDGAGKFRVPTRLELHSLINYKRSGIKVDDSMIEGAQAAEYWTLSPTFDAQSPYSYSNWAIHLEDGRSYSRIVERNKARFICVSDSPSKPKPPEEHYLNHGDYVEDLATGLFWAKDTTKGSSIHQLADNCNALNHGNMRWRIPSQKELASLLDVTQAAKQPTIDPIFQGELRLQSSTALIDKREFNYHGINFATGYPSKGSASATRCVNQWKNNTSADRIHRGDIYIGGDDYHRSNELYQQLEDAHYKKIEGDLYIETTNLLAIYLPFLEEVTGDIYFNGNKKLETIAFPKLKKVGGSLRIDGNQQLDRIEASRLTEIGGDLYIGRNQSLGKTQDPMDNGTKRKPIDFYQLQSIKGNLDIEINPQLKGFVMQSLIEVGKRLQITQNDSLWTFNFNRLQSIGYLCKDTQDFCGNLGLYLNYRLQYASFPFLSKVLSSFIVQGNQKLEKIGERINTLNLRLDVSGNQALCEIYEIDPIISRMWKLGRHPAGVSVGNNNRETRCLSRCPDLDHCQILSDSN